MSIIIAASITKQAQFHNVTERWANVYHYLFPMESNAGVQDPTAAKALVDELIAVERPLHANNVVFVEGRVWGPIGQGQALSDTVGIWDFNLSGSGAAADPYWSMEDCIVVSMRTNRQDSKSRPVYLRKYLRKFTGAGGSSLSSQQHARNAVLDAAINTQITTYADDIAGTASIAGYGIGVLCAPSGAQVPLSAPRTIKIGKYLESHEVKY